MTMDAVENTMIGAAPIELYNFTSYLTTWAYTNWDQDVTRDGVTYFASLPISRNEPEFSEETSHSQLQVKTSRDHPIIDAILQNPPHDGIMLTVFRTALDETQKVMRWQGRVISISMADDGWNATILCDPVESLTGKASFRHTYGPNCRKRLFDSQCKVIEAAYTADYEITAISTNGLVLTSPGFAGRAVNYWQGGDIWVADLRMYVLIMSSTGSTVTVRKPVTGLAVGHSGKIRPGCNHLWTKADGSWGDCKAKFSNTINFGGYPFCPTTKNPYLLGLEA